MALNADTLRELAKSLGQPNSKLSRPDVAKALNDAAALVDRLTAQVRSARNDAARNAWERFYGDALRGYMSDPTVLASMDDEETSKVIANVREIAGRSMEVWRQAPWVKQSDRKPAAKNGTQTAAPAGVAPGGAAPGGAAPGGTAAPTDSAAASASQPAKPASTGDIDF